MCKRIILSVLSIFFILYLWILAYRTPMPILNDISDAEIIGVRYNSVYGYGYGLVTDNTEFDAQSVLKCISEYEEQNSFSRIGNRGYCIDDYTFIITIHSIEDGFIEIFIGNSEDDIYINEFDGIKHKIINASALKEELETLIIKGRF